MASLAVVIGVFVFLLYSFIDLKIALVYAVAGACFAIPILLNHYGFYRTASLTVLTINTIVILTASIIGGFGIEIHPLLIVMTLCSSLLLLSFIHALLFNITLMTLYIFTRLYSDGRGPLIENEVFALREFVNFSLSIISAFVIARFILKSLLKYIDSLETTLQELTETNKQIATQNARLELFNSIAAHDLRTPIRNFTSFATLAKKSIIEHKKEEKILEHLDMALQYSGRMNELVNSIASLNSIKRVESEKIIEINLCAHIAKLKDQYQSQFNKEVNITCDDKILIYSKLSHCNIIFDNLLQNAIKYNEQEVVNITIKSSLVDQVLSIFIIDNGIGIHEDYQTTIFDPFSKLHSPEEYAGTGLGLYIVREILYLYEASISVSRNKDIGSTFKIQIPYAD